MGCTLVQPSAVQVLERLPGRDREEDINNTTSIHTLVCTPRNVLIVYSVYSENEDSKIF